MSQTSETCPKKPDWWSAVTSMCEIALNQMVSFVSHSVMWWGSQCDWRLPEHYISWLSESICCQPALSLGAGCGGGMADGGGRAAGLGYTESPGVRVWLFGAKGLPTGKCVHESWPVWEVMRKEVFSFFSWQLLFLLPCVYAACSRTVAVSCLCQQSM